MLSLFTLPLSPPFSLSLFSLSLSLSLSRLRVLLFHDAPLYARGEARGGDEDGGGEEDYVDEARDCFFGDCVGVFVADFDSSDDEKGRRCPSSSFAARSFADRWTQQARS